MELVLCGPDARLPMPLWLLGMGSSAVFGTRSAGQDVHNPQPMLDKQKVQAGLCFELPIIIIIECTNLYIIYILCI